MIRTGTLQDALQPMTAPLFLLIALLLAATFAWIFVKMTSPSRSQNSPSNAIARLFQNGSPARVAGQCIFWIVGGLVSVTIGLLLSTALATPGGVIVALLGWLCLVLGAALIALGVAGLWTSGNRA